MERLDPTARYPMRLRGIGIRYNHSLRVYRGGEALVQGLVKDRCLGKETYLEWQCDPNRVGAIYSLIRVPGDTLSFDAGRSMAIYDPFPHALRIRLSRSVGDRFNPEGWLIPGSGDTHLENLAIELKQALGQALLQSA